ncbi:dolichol monophosphate mannose synthase [Candidatus Peregrinibacteria bacterium CG10_big_fil_rev_8_21_14_0_10_49_24]|nr:MAG: dolichol monophosphate mannose synthase [Candidatus Peregrinibacteria bacterium CG11_big_fil_rev_8_21_14_0_20_49_14]PIR51522.1 MAG: dolichol monophosphate mannose synthase [Candidatus Peregrinibacteria bacterium CG10_big_fil_rev_8_21_14_0_10_49_24]PJA67835.1 MAG: dolichol monophosphate mannose synthase [Candidatus Peregrinibacteria bacterium CG_4_9_14_3_um_filter_49_12]
MFSLILPTYNEAENIPELVRSIKNALACVPHEIIIVDDDSPDKTWHIAQEIAHDQDDVHIIRRVGRRGLSSAVIEGFLSAKGDVFGVMDADGQHDESLLPALYEAALANGGISVGSRYTEGGSVGEWDEQRYLLSRIATKLAMSLCKVKVKDPMSGFFAVHRSTFEKVLPTLNPKGFKILLDFLVHVPKETRAEEIPFTFGKRMHGESKLSRRVQIEFLEYLYDVALGRFIPLVFVKYCIVGSMGVIVHVSAFSLISYFFAGAAEPTFRQFSLSVAVAIETAVVFNFLLNNAWTFSHVRLKGRAALVGFLKFNGACLFGALANYAVSAFLFSFGFAKILSVVVGAFTGVIWNYTMNRMLTWRH